MTGRTCQICYCLPPLIMLVFLCLLVPFFTGCVFVSGSREHIPSCVSPGALCSVRSLAVDPQVCSVWILVFSTVPPLTNCGTIHFDGTRVLSKPSPTLTFCGLDSQLQLYEVGQERDTRVGDSFQSSGALACCTVCLLEPVHHLESQAFSQQ